MRFAHILLYGVQFPNFNSFFFHFPHISVNLKIDERSFTEMGESKIKRLKRNWNYYYIDNIINLNLNKNIYG